MIKKIYPKSNQIIISSGDPAGIGIEIILKALASPYLPKEMEPIIIGCKRNFYKNYKHLKSNGLTNLVHPDDLHIIDIRIYNEIKLGNQNSSSGAASFDCLTHAYNYLIKNKARALVTAPISKIAWHLAGHNYQGQTERLAELSKTNNPSMLFTAVSPKSGIRINTLLATTHIPLNNVAKELTPELIEFKLNVLADFCKRFTINPKIAVAGLNPHAGEEGQIGREEITWLVPLLRNWQEKNKDVKLIGPIPPDTCWLNTAKAWENNSLKDSPTGILALYHDQGLIPMKLIAFDEAVNTTLGLPFIRTSPDHGTAFDIAGRGLARENSMLAALQASWDLSSFQKTGEPKQA